MEDLEAIKNFLDKDGIKLTSWPAKRSRQVPVLQFLANKFEIGKEYTEKDINLILNDLHTFSDPALLRRELYEKKFLGRTLDGRMYWKIGSEASK